MCCMIAAGSICGSEARGTAGAGSAPDPDEAGVVAAGVPDWGFGASLRPHPAQRAPATIATRIRDEA